jgi:hypothetical protein
MQLKSKLIGSGALLLALGGAGTATALAQASGASTAPVKHTSVVKPAAVGQATASEVTSPDTDNVQEGDQTTPDVPAAKTTAKAASTSESEGAGESENSPSDGPGGYADAPGNPDTQQTGEN